MKRQLLSFSIAIALVSAAQTIKADDPYNSWATSWVDHTDASESKNATVKHGQNLAEEARETYLPYPLNDRQNGSWRGFQGGTFGLWRYADATGRVRAHVQSGISESKFGYLRLSWKGGFIRTSDDDPEFTINPSWLELRAASYGQGELRDRAGKYDKDLAVLPPYARMDFKVYVYNDGPLEQIAIHHRSGISGISPDSLLPRDLNVPASALASFDVDYDKTEGYDYLLDRVTGERFHRFPTDDYPLRDSSGNITGYRLDVGPYSDTIPLKHWGIEINDFYRIQYIMEVEAGEDGIEHLAESIFGDPLDVDGNGVPFGGLTITTDDEPAESTPQICDQPWDPTRIVINGDGTATDTKTNLMWQRCPVDTSLNDQGTATDYSDDTCTSLDSAAVDWQTALQEAQTNVLAGFADWRVPNVKALATIVTAGCSAPATDSWAFPSTPWENFWSATPLAAGAESWAVDFFDGDVVPQRRNKPAYVRLVRQNPDGQPLPQRPTLVVANASIAEPSGGETNQLLFPLKLSGPATQAVTVDFETRDITATVGDYTPVTGSIDIPAGQTSSQITVDVIGDNDAEPSEALGLIIATASTNVHLAEAGATGTIIDNSPALFVDATSVREEDSGTHEMIFKVGLTDSYPTPITVDFSTLDASATAGSDYTATTGSLTFAAGEQAKEIPVTINGDFEPENDEVLMLVLTDPSGAHLAAGFDQARGTIANDDVLVAIALNDTGVEVCADALNTALSCPQAGFEPQDADIGLDAVATNDDDGLLGFSYTKLANDGSDLPFDAAQWSCLRDDVTGLVWERKAFNSADLHDEDNTYSWYASSGVNDGGNAGTDNGGVCAGGSSCDTEGFVADVNSEQLCGFADWRLPSVEEIFQLANMDYGGRSSRGVDSWYWPGTRSFPGAYYWTSTPAAGDSSSAWTMHFETPESSVQLISKDTPAYVRLVRGGQTL